MGRNNFSDFFTDTVTVAKSYGQVFDLLNRVGVSVPPADGQQLPADNITHHSRSSSPIGSVLQNVSRPDGNRESGSDETDIAGGNVEDQYLYEESNFSVEHFSEENVSLLGHATAAALVLENSQCDCFVDARQLRSQLSYDSVLLLVNAALSLTKASEDTRRLWGLLITMCLPIGAVPISASALREFMTSLRNDYVVSKQFICQQCFADLGSERIRCNCSLGSHPVVGPGSRERNIQYIWLDAARQMRSLVSKFHCRIVRNIFKNERPEYWNSMCDADVMWNAWKGSGPNDFILHLFCSTDGAKKDRLSGTDLWPVLYYIVGLDQADRELFDNTILPVLLIQPSGHPNGDKLMSELIGNLPGRLTADCKECGAAVVFTPKLQFFAADLVARNIFLSMVPFKQHNACCYCVAEQSYSNASKSYLFHPPELEDLRTESMYQWIFEQIDNGVEPPILGMEPSCALLRHIPVICVTIEGLHTMMDIYRSLLGTILGRPKRKLVAVNPTLMTCDEKSIADFDDLVSRTTFPSHLTNRYTLRPFADFGRYSNVEGMLVSSLVVVPWLRTKICLRNLAGEPSGLDTFYFVLATCCALRTMCKSDLSASDRDRIRLLCNVILDTADTFWAENIAVIKFHTLFAHGPDCVSALSAITSHTSAPMESSLHFIRMDMHSVTRNFAVICAQHYLDRKLLLEKVSDLEASAPDGLLKELCQTILYRTEKSRRKHFGMSISGLRHYDKIGTVYVSRFKVPVDLSRFSAVVRNFFGDGFQLPSSSPAIVRFEGVKNHEVLIVRSHASQRNMRSQRNIMELKLRSGVRPEFIEVFGFVIYQQQVYCVGDRLEIAQIHSELRPPENQRLRAAYFSGAFENYFWNSLVDRTPFVTHCSHFSGYAMLLSIDKATFVISCDTTFTAF